MAPKQQQHEHEPVLLPPLFPDLPEDTETRQENHEAPCSRPELTVDRRQTAAVKLRPKPLVPAAVEAAATASTAASAPETQVLPTTVMNENNNCSSSWVASLSPSTLSSPPPHQTSYRKILWRNQRDDKDGCPAPSLPVRRESSSRSRHGRRRTVQLPIPSLL